MTKPTLYVFAISHYCEKARWALDYLGIEYELGYLAPGLHARTAKALGLTRSSLPILKTGQEIIQGSAAIIDWAEANTTLNESLAAGTESDAAIAIEQRLDDVLGVHVRRYYYSEALVNYPQLVRPIFTHDLTGIPKLFTHFGWNRICQRMIKGMDLGAEQHHQSRALVLKELDWLDGLLADGRQFLIGNRLSRADITAASLLAPLINSPQHHTVVALPPLVSADCELWRERKIMRRIAGLYAQFRHRT